MYIELHTPRLLLRPVALSDLEAVHAYAGNPENTRYMYFLPNESLSETRNFLLSAAADWAQECPAAYEFAVVLKGTLIGAVSVTPDCSRTVGEVGWILHKDYWGKGYAYEAARAVCSFAQENLGIRQLIAHCDARNAASQRVMEKLGMVLQDSCGTRTYPRTGETAREFTYQLP